VIIDPSAYADGTDSFPASDLDLKYYSPAPAVSINTRETGGIYDEGIQGPDYRS
jgi:hypothetical protein